MSTTPPPRPRSALRWVTGTALGFWVLACGSGLPEVRPGLLDSPKKTETHGRFVEKSYTRSNGPNTIAYKILEVDGTPLRIENGFVEHTAYCTQAGIDAVGFSVRGPAGVSGVFVLQLDGSEQQLERLCDYGPVGSWSGAVFDPGPCERAWDAAKRKRIKR